jgi:hypothetical protein
LVLWRTSCTQTLLAVRFRFFGSLVCLVDANSPSTVKAGWSLVFQTPQDSGDPLACVALAGAQLMLGTSSPQFLPTESRESVTGLALQPWGEQAFHAVLLGYRFLIAAEHAEPADLPSGTAN